MGLACVPPPDGVECEQGEGDAGRGAEGVENHVGGLAGAAGDEQLVDLVGGGVEGLTHGSLRFRNVCRIESLASRSMR